MSGTSAIPMPVGGSIPRAPSCSEAEEHRGLQPPPGDPPASPLPTARGLHPGSTCLYRKAKQSYWKTIKRWTSASQDSLPHCKPWVMHLPWLLPSAEVPSSKKLRRGHSWDSHPSWGLLPCVSFLPRLLASLHIRA